MNKNNNWLNDFKHNIASQSGEDGIIEKILATIAPPNKWCVEFGAWDGKHLSNTYNLITNHGYSAVLIEANKKKFSDLENTFNSNNNVITVNKFVGFNKDDRLDSILNKTQIPTDFDLLSIDIDGNDYHIWKAVAAYKPKVVCIEYNPSIPNEVDFIQPANAAISQGASPSSLTKLAKQKNYELVAATDLNCIFVHKKYFHLFEITDNSLHILRPSPPFVTYIFTGYDGSVFISGDKRLLWHDQYYDTSSLQQLPKYLRSFPPNYNKFQRLFFSIYKYFKRFNIFQIK